MAIAVTVAIERLGGRLGGLLGTLPTTIVPASFGLLQNDPEVFRQALNLAPAGMLLNAGFLWLWRALPDRVPRASLPIQLGVMLLLTLLAWTLGAVALTTSTRTALAAGLPPEAIGLGGTFAVIAFGVIACLDGVPAPRGTRRVGLFTLLARGLLAGGAIAVSLAIARAGHGIVAGVASVFPAIFVTAMVSVWWSQGRAVSGGAVGPMMLGSAAVAVYAVVAAWTMPGLGGLVGAIVAWCLAVGAVTVPANLWLRSREQPA